ncbi:carboxypeptidase-like regulatory domain-containing protein [Hanstruepera flava]|uniref:carboxypeptidase-like regulatory domain-containing protein n=1 Tax=Hanstruepera flava TaxID=2930218 RepID=UPI0020288108|nr:carboxypeptidase-like regulatory domain-containing protein [Hanstruepera flava]
MYLFRFFLLLLLVVSNLNAQTFEGKVYDSKSVLENIKVFNSTKQVLTYSNRGGHFSIQAAVNDTLIFSSLFYQEQTILVTETHLNQINVIELKEATNALDEVSIQSVKKKDEQTLTVEVQRRQNSQIANDIKNNPHLYGLSPSTNVDFVAIFKLIGKLFKNKKKTVQEIALYQDFNDLFLTDSFFTDDLLKNELNIPDNLKQLFFEYCGAHNIDKKLLSKNNQVHLLEELIQLSQSFLILVENTKH